MRHGAELFLGLLLRLKCGWFCFGWKEACFSPGLCADSTDHFCTAFLLHVLFAVSYVSVVSNLCGVTFSPLCSRTHYQRKLQNKMHGTRLVYVFCPIAKSFYKATMIKPGAAGELDMSTSALYGFVPAKARGERLNRHAS